jgi:hypothetical protein
MRGCIAVLISSQAFNYYQPLISSYAAFGLKIISSLSMVTEE